MQDMKHPISSGGERKASAVSSHGKLNFPPDAPTPTHERLSSTDQARVVHLQTALVIRPPKLNRESRGNSFGFSKGKKLRC